MTEALSLMFESADAGGLEEDVRLTAMWLWTLHVGTKAATADEDEDAEADSDDDDDVAAPQKGKLSGFVLARKIAQGLGAHLEEFRAVVEVRKDKARLLPVSERARALFGNDAAPEEAPGARGKAKAAKNQLGLFGVGEIEAVEKQGLLGETGASKVGKTTLDRLHQAMILFGAVRSEALKRFVVEDGVGKDGRFWKLAQSFSALYPAGSDEKRWVDSVLARKKGLGF